MFDGKSLQDGVEKCLEWMTIDWLISFMSEVYEKGHSKWRWVDGAKELLKANGISENEENRLAYDRIIKIICKDATPITK